VGDFGRPPFLFPIQIFAIKYLRRIIKSMAGILDSKQRVMDTLVTLPGRFQASSGHMQFRYVTFTDRNAFYEGSLAPTGSAVANDASDRVYFEASQRFQDLICLETTLNGLVNFEFTTPFTVPDSELAVVDSLYSFYSISGSAPTGSIINALVGGVPEQITKGMISSYQQQHFLATINPFDKNQQFILSTGSLEFDFNDVVPNHPIVPVMGDVNTLPPVWVDHRFANKPNFVFLPPINRPPPGAQLERILPFILADIDFNALPFSDAMTILEGQLENIITALGPGLIKNTSMEDAPTEFMTSLKLGTQLTQDPGSQLEVAAAMMNLKSAAATYGALLTKEDYVAAKLSFMRRWSGLANTAYYSRLTTLQQVMDNLRAKSSIAGSDPSGPQPGEKDYHASDENIIIGDVVSFPETSVDNNLVMQIFEFPKGENKIQKLTILDAGELADENVYGPNQHLFYAGKMFKKEDGNMCFASIFTIIMHNSQYAAQAGEDWFGFALKDPANKFAPQNAGGPQPETQ
jgi:hypothetical protein